LFVDDDVMDDVTPAWSNTSGGGDLAGLAGAVLDGAVVVAASRVWTADVVVRVTRKWSVTTNEWSE